MHIVLDNLSAHQTQTVQQFLADRPKVPLPRPIRWTSY